MLLLVNFLWSVIDIIGYECLFEILVFERSFAFLVSLASYFFPTKASNLVLKVFLKFLLFTLVFFFLNS